MSLILLINSALTIFLWWNMVKLRRQSNWNSDRLNVHSKMIGLNSDRITGHWTATEALAKVSGVLSPEETLFSDNHKD